MLLARRRCCCRCFRRALRRDLPLLLGVPLTPSSPSLPLAPPSPHLPPRPPFSLLPALQILLGIQELLDAPNPLSPAQSDAFVMYQQRREEYKRRVKQEAAK